MPDTELAAVDSVGAVAVAADRGRNPYWTYLARLDSDESKRTIGGCLDRIASIFTAHGWQPVTDNDYQLGALFPWHALRYQHVIMIRANLTSRDWSPSHVNKHLSAIRGVLRECWRLQLMGAEDMHRAIDVKQVKAHREPAGRHIAEDETRKMLAACLAEPGPLGIRDAAIITALCSTGGRRSEVAGMLIERYQRAERSVSIIGKGNKERTGYVHPTAVPYIDAWLAIVDTRRGPLFRPVDRWGNIAPQHLTARSIGLVVSRRRKEVRLPPLTTHDYRRTFIGDLLDEGVDLLTVQELVGHASPVTTGRYDRRPGRKRRAAVDLLRLPVLSELNGSDQHGTGQ